MKEINQVTEGKREFLVIGAGFGRTGTWSMMHALEILLPGKCHHMSKAMSYHQEEWREILTGNMTDDEFANFFLSNNYVAAVGAPFLFIWERALKVFPNAKVILTVREPKSWVKSVKSTIFTAFAFDFPFTIFALLGLFPLYLGHPKMETTRSPKVLMKALITFDGYKGFKKAVDDGKGVEYFNKWNENVIEKVPEDNLLIFQVKEGWGPLCRFLDVAEPDVPFPRVNETAEFQEWIKRRRQRSWLLLFEIVTLPLLAYASYYCYYNR